ncbi:Secreted subtilisin-like serine protease sub5 [Orbilia oligospora]|nr:Secreted subtilisin-like serine protease sub5 [Orbilia oligospora]
MRTNSHNLWVLSLLFEILIGQTLAVRFSWPWRKGGKLPVISINSKIGTIDQYIEKYDLLVKPGYRKDKGFRQKVEAALRKVAAPPQALNTYAVESSFLGCVAFEVATEQGSRDAISKVRNKFNKKLNKPILVHSDPYAIDNNGYLYEAWKHAAWTIPESEAIPRSFPNGSDSSSEVAMRETSGDLGLDHGLSSPPPHRYLRLRDPNHHQENRRSPADPASTFNTDQAPVVVDFYSGGMPEMRQISQPPELQKNLEDQIAEFGHLALAFWNYKEAGKGQVVYVLDTGFDHLHKELSNVEFGDWIMAGYFPTDEKGSYDISLNRGWHGSEVASKVAGKTLGAAREAKIIPVHYPPGRTGSGRGAAIAIIDAFAKIYDHIRGVNNKSNCIVNVSLCLDLGYWRDVFLWNQVGFGTSGEIMGHYGKAMYYILEELNLLPNAILVISAGNGLGTEVDGMPATFGAQFESKRTVVVGGTDLDGNNIFQKSNFVRVSAPATRITVPCGPKGPTNGHRMVNGRFNICQFSHGTSFSAPMVTGVLATMLSAGVPIDKVIKHMYSLAYPRIKGGPRILYNGISTSQWHW